MDTVNLEKRFDALEAQNKKLQREVERLQAYVEISNLMGRYEYWQTASMGTEIAKYFAKKTPGVRAEMMWGVFDGYEHAALDLFGKGHSTPPDAPPDMGKGRLAMHTLTNQVIEVAADGKTAKAVWISPGHETGSAGPGEKPEAHWAWCKYGIDFVKEDGKWKFWHFQIFGLFHCTYYKSWTEEWTHAAMTNLPPERTPNRPPTYSWYYTPDSKVENVPAPPAPYETWDGKSVTTALDLLE